ncbi:Uu.00g013900.m01.CDS01 [Anthostomella pinea]|uniref:Uu.00g013900.m01.CDS01 n=1 Tax=Anthostomella pinea TaxID=933095 RepID=A0AAI8VSG1_9PEZI|nr:Uu.00g013900.m01.CDS01 [Anthostomella pinea]
MSSRSHGSDASRRPSNILAASPNTRLNQDNIPTITSSHPTKRRHDESYAMEDLLKPSVVVKSHPPNISVKPRSLQPLMLLPREHLQLSFLNFSSPYGSFESSSQSFESNIKILHLEGRMGARSVVLIARLETDKTVYAIERQTNGLYTLCQLGFWVDLESLCALATVSCLHLIKKRPDAPTDSNTPLPSVTPLVHHEHKRRLAIEAIQSLVNKPRSRSISTSTQPPTAAQGHGESQSESRSFTQDAYFLREPGSQADAESQVTLAAEPGKSLAVPTSDSILENIRNQYFTALYHSMGSLAYFAKGPLSRARAAFHLDCDSTLEMNDLIDFLRSLVMTTVQIDKKYRETVPEIVSKMKTTFQDSDVEQDAKARKRKAKKMKLGRDGLYPTEDEHVRKWWTINKPLPKDDGTNTAEPQETKLQISCLRSRETQLQMIIILEILALEPLRTSATGNDSQLPALPIAEETLETSKEVPAKKRNKHNFPLLLDVHADRLCIWQSTALDEVKMLDSQANSGPEPQKSLRATSDPLKDFCVDIIVPFFSARLPEQCDSINRKLGGPVIAPSPKSKSKKAEGTTKPKTKPGAAAKRPAQPKSSRTLDRVLSKESERTRRSMSRGPGGMIALMRSASTPTWPMLKREASEPLSMTSIPTTDSVASQEKIPRPSGLGSTKCRSDEEKAKQDALVKAELQEAISSLRRPNRDVVGKAMAEAAERRATTSLSQLKKSRKPTHHPQFQDIVKATPTGNRFRDAIAKSKEQQSARRWGMESIGEDHLPSSSSIIPSSGPRKRNRDAAFADDDSPALPSFRASRTNHVEATPARPSTLSRDFLSVPGPDEAIVLASSPVFSRKMSQLSYQAPPRIALDHRDSGIGMPSSPVGGLAETPVKPRYGPASGPLERYMTVTPAKKRIVDNGKAVAIVDAESARGGEDENRNEEVKENPSNGTKRSFFEQLGWDDYDDLG